MIEFHNVSKTYPRQIGERAAHRALTDASFVLPPGGTLGLVGQNGAGKSTTLRILMGYMRPDAGEARVLGRDPAEAAVRRRVGYLPEISTFPENLTCAEMLRFVGRCRGMDEQRIARAAEAWLKRLELWEARNRLLRGFSKGMKQRASFAAALIHDPELLILDEPMSGLDPLGRADIVSLIRELREAGKSILFCSHLLDDVQRLTDSLVVLHRGRILFAGGVEELRHRFTREGEAPPDLQDAFIALVRDADTGGRP